MLVVDNFHVKIRYTYTYLGNSHDIVRCICIEYTRLFVKSQINAVLCISYAKCIFLLCYSPKPTLLLKHINTFFSFTQFDSMKPIQLLKT